MDTDRLNTIKSNLARQKGIHGVSIVQPDNKVYIETDLPCSIVHKHVETEFGCVAVLKGIGASNINNNDQTIRTDAAVSIISSFDENIEQVRGVVRFVQLNGAKCAIDGILTGYQDHNSFYSYIIIYHCVRDD